MMQRNQRTTPSERAAEDLTDRASRAEASGNLREAERLSESVLREFPKHAEARFVQARVRARTGRLSTATETFRDLLAQNPDFDAARMALIGALFLTNSFSEGLSHLQQIARRCDAELSDTEETMQEAEAVLAPLWASYTDRKGLK